MSTNETPDVTMIPLDETLIQQNNETVTEAVVSEDFVNADNVDAFKLLSLKSKMNDINSVMENINKEQKQLLSDDTEFDHLDKILDNFTEEQIKAMPPEMIDELLVDEDGNKVTFALDFKTNKIAYDQFKKDFLILRKQSLETFKKFDEELAGINKEIAESQEEFDKYVNEFGNVSNLIRTKLDERLKNAETDEQKALVSKLIKSFDNGLLLENVKEYCNSYKGRSIIGDFTNHKQAHYIYRKYLKVANTLDIKTDLTTFTNLEQRFLPEEYQKRINIFMFAIIHFISSWHNKAYTKADGLFITQFTVNVKNLYYDKFDIAEDRETFINNIKEIIKIID